MWASVEKLFSVWVASWMIRQFWGKVVWDHVEVVLKNSLLFWQGCHGLCVLCLALLIGLQELPRLKASQHWGLPWHPRKIWGHKRRLCKSLLTIIT